MPSELPRFDSSWFIRSPVGPSFSQFVVNDKVTKALFRSQSNRHVSKKLKKLAKGFPFEYPDITSRGDRIGPFGDFYTLKEEVITTVSDFTVFQLWELYGPHGDQWRRFDSLPTRVFASLQNVGELVSTESDYPFIPTSEPFLPYLDFSEYTLRLNAIGTTGIRRARPGRPLANLFQFIGELRDLPRAPLRELHRLRNFMSLGSEYLNVVFGWQPFVKDLEKLYFFQIRLQKVLDDLIAENNTGIRRRRQVNRDTTTTVIDEWEQPAGGPQLDPSDWYAGVRPPPPTDLGDITVQLLANGGYPIYMEGGEGLWKLFVKSFRVSKEVNRDEWFNGVFRYFISDPSSSQWTEQAIRALTGGNPTPSELYELIPWSWLIDWFTNVGDILSNYSENAVNPLLDNAFAHIGGSTSYKFDCVISSVGPLDYQHGGNGMDGVDAPCSFSIKVSPKVRHRADPYGFGSDFETLSLFQLSVLAALGITRSRFPF